MPQSVQDDEENKKKYKRPTKVAVFGTFIEYYDFSIYGYVAATIATVFFPKGNDVVNLLNTLAVFGLAFLVRPLGAWYFGQLGDKRGRRTSLIASIALMGIASTVAGLLPNYNSIGIFAPILLILMRMLQGFSTGAKSAARLPTSASGHLRTGTHSISRSFLPSRSWARGLQRALPRSSPWS